MERWLAQIAASKLCIRELPGPRFANEILIHVDAELLPLPQGQKGEIIPQTAEKFAAVSKPRSICAGSGPLIPGPGIALPVSMLEIRFHGRGGQGAVVASQILARAAHLEGYHVQAFPDFGVERRGAPVAAFTRLSRNPIRTRTKIYNPDFAVVFDGALLGFVDIASGVKWGGGLLVNAPEGWQENIPDGPLDLALVDASSIAASHGIGTSTSPIVNTTVMGAFAAFSRLVSVDSVCEAIRESFPKGADRNVAAAREAAEKIVRVHHFGENCLNQMYNM